MSSRQIRKLRQQQELLRGGNPDVDVDEESGEEPVAPKPRTSLFAGLAALQDEDEDESQEDEGRHDAEEAELEKEPGASGVTPVPAPTEIVKPPAANKKKHKRNKGKSKAQTVTAEKDETQTAQRPARATKPSDMDEIDQALHDLAVADKARGSGDKLEGRPESDEFERIAQLLRINFYHLKAINEMRKLFGRDVIESVNIEESAAPRQGAALMENVDLETYLKGVPGQSLPTVILRKNPFVDGKITWPKSSAGGLSMTQISEAGAVPVEFAFSHDKQYQDLEAEFFMYAVGLDAMPMVHFLHKHPYHVSSLIQVSKIAKQDQNASLSSDLCERALFTMGRVTLSAFRKKLEEGKARLDFRRPENRQFLLAAYHYIKSLIVRGTFRTALEWAKLTLSVDPSDSYGILHFIHSSAIRAGEARWLVDLCDSELLEQNGIAEAIYIRQTVTLAWLQLKDPARAKSHLGHMMSRLPSLYCALFKALNLDTPKSIWGIEAHSPDEELFNQLHIHTTKELWNNAEALALLKKVAGEIEKPQTSALPRPPEVQLRIARFITLDNTPALLSHLPREFSKKEPNYDFDPLPPAENENIFSYEGQRQAWTYRRSGIPASSFADLLRHRRADLERMVGGPEALARLVRELDESPGDDLDESVNDNDESIDETIDGSHPGSGGMSTRLLHLLESIFPWRASRAEGNDEEEEEEDSEEGMPALEHMGDGHRGDGDEDSSDDELPPLVASDHPHN